MTFHTLGVISDTHDDVEAVQSVLNLFESYGVERIIHCGDITSPDVLAYFRGIQTDFVLGNCDNIFHNELVMGIREIGAVCYEEEGDILWCNKRVYFTHGNKTALLDAAKYSGEWDLVCSGHSHQYENETYGKTRILNPGSLQSGSCCVVNSSLVIKHFNALTGRSI